MTKGRPQRRRRHRRKVERSTKGTGHQRFPWAAAKPKAPQAGMLIFMLAWLGLATVLASSAVRDIRLNSGPHARATVVSLTDMTRTRDETALVTYPGPDGATVQAHVYTGFLHGAPTPGQVVQIAYDPGDPRSARLIGADDLFQPVTYFAAATLVLLLLWRRTSKAEA